MIIKGTRRLREHQKQAFNPTTEQQAQLSLIQISNSDLIEDPLPEFNSQPPIDEVSPVKPKIKIRIKQSPINFLRVQHKSTDLKNNNADKFTEAHKSSRRSSCAELQTDQVCVITRKLPLSLSSYLVLDQDKKFKAQQVASLTYKPKPCINTRTYFRKRAEVKNEQQMNWTFRPRYQARKLYPCEQTYWKIYRGGK